jgi:hypothetical protein
MTAKTTWWAHQDGFSDTIRVCVERKFSDGRIADCSWLVSHPTAWDYQPGVMPAKFVHFDRLFQSQCSQMADAAPPVEKDNG